MNCKIFIPLLCLLTAFPLTELSAQTIEQAQEQDKAYMFEEAVNTYEAFIARQTKRRRSVDNAPALMERSRAHLRMLKGTEEVCIVDSIVVDKDNFLSAYRLSNETGTLESYNKFFRTDANDAGTVYETSLRDRIYYAQKGKGGYYDIYKAWELRDGWDEPELIDVLANDSTNANYPFVMNDGITLYYAADGAGSMGGYDIFVTRYDPDNETYLTPDNVGMPFNSPFNDMMLVIDEWNNLGWFASDRYQPSDKLCLYIFIPNATKRVYNYETTDKARLARLARIASLKETWGAATPEQLSAARTTLKTLLQSPIQETQ
ncbi:MAG: hypothetical protein LBL78_05840 [Prevotellaceae bacterium]|jgi:hypothetical protein|nr:hypothetical protein [Prevotellaceae bacterium]